MQSHRFSASRSPSPFWPDPIGDAARACRGLKRRAQSPAGGHPVKRPLVSDADNEQSLEMSTPAPVEVRKPLISSLELSGDQLWPHKKHGKPTVKDVLLFPTSMAFFKSLSRKTFALDCTPQWGHKLPAKIEQFLYEKYSPRPSPNLDIAYFHIGRSSQLHFPLDLYLIFPFARLYRSIHTTGYLTNQDFELIYDNCILPGLAAHELTLLTWGHAFITSQDEGQGIYTGGIGKNRAELEKPQILEATIDQSLLNDIWESVKNSENKKARDLCSDAVLIAYGEAPTYDWNVPWAEFQTRFDARIDASHLTPETRIGVELHLGI